MYCNRYLNDIDGQPGDQPIRIFYQVIHQEFNSILNEFKAIDKYNRIGKVKLEILTINSRIHGPEVRISTETNSKIIALHDTFLSFLWAYTHGIFVLTPMPGKWPSADDIKRSRELLMYAKSLNDVYSEWDRYNLVNPEVFLKDDINFISTSNMIYAESIRFILLHEFAHVFLNHLDDLNPSRFWEYEYDADYCATEWALNASRGKHTEVTMLGVISALNSLSYTNNQFRESEKHPSPEDRLIRFLSRLNLTDEDYSWIYSLWSIMQWQTLYEAFYPIPIMSIKTKNHKSMFFEMITELKEFKNTGINKFRPNPV